MSDFIEQMKNLSQKITRVKETLQTEEATKTALVMPFLAALGYDVFDPTEITPEFTADMGIKKGEKVDYAIMRDGKPIILIECKKAGASLNNEQASQLFRYFVSVPARVGILTDGITYRFFTDLEQPNIMDSTPFLEVNLIESDGGTLEHLKKFRKSDFSIEAIISGAGELKYIREFKRIMREQMQTPSAEFVKLFARQVYDSTLTQKAIDQFTPFVSRAFRGVIDDMINDRLKTALALGNASISAVPVQPEAGQQPTEEKKDIVTTGEEVEGYLIIKSILRELIAPDRIVMRDTQSYCGILLDDNNRRPLARLHFNRQQKYIGIITDLEKTEERIAIQSLNELYQLAPRLIATAKMYDAKPETVTSLDKA